MPADEPLFTHMHPAGVQKGTSIAVKLVGRFHPWPCRVVADSPGIVFSAGKESGNFIVTVAAEVAPGPHLLRAVNDDGASAPVAMVVDAGPQTLEVEPNNDFRSPQVLPTTTATCNGRLDKSDDVDSFLVTLKKGQVMACWVEAYVLSAGFDAMLRVVDSTGAILAFNHDHLTLDPFLVFTAPSDGTYILQTMGHKYPASTEVRFTGGDDCVYRLHVSTEPLVRNAWPLAVQRGTKSCVTLEGWNLRDRRLEVDDTSAPGVLITLSETPELIETPAPQTLDVPCAVSGRIDHAGDEDRFGFVAARETMLELSVSGPRQGSAIDAWLKVLDKDGKELASNDDDQGSSEPRIVWTAPADGTYTALVGERTQRGGSEFFYRLVIRRAEPSISASVATHSVKVEAGKSAEVKVAVALNNGFRAKQKLAARGLPAGVSAREVDVPEKSGEVALSLTAEPAAQRSSSPFRLVLVEAEGGRERPVFYPLSSVWREQWRAAGISGVADQLDGSTLAHRHRATTPAARSIRDTQRQAV